MTKKFLSLVALGALLAAFTLGGTSLADGRRVPEAVRDAIARAFPNAKIGGTARERIVVTVYELKLREGKDRFEVTVAEDGTVVAVEREVERGALPPAVAKRLAKAAGEARVKEIDHVERRAKLGVVKLASPTVYYEAEWRGHEVQIGEDGVLAGDDADDDGDRGGYDDDDDDDDDDDRGGYDDDDDDDDDDRGGYDDDDDDDDDRGGRDDDDDDDDD